MSFSWLLDDISPLLTVLNRLLIKAVMDTQLVRVLFILVRCETSGEFVTVAVTVGWVATSLGRLFTETYNAVFKTQTHSKDDPRKMM